jgi:hypothetical protein
MTDGGRADLVVVVPARNEADRIGVCLTSIANQAGRTRVLVSDNASDDDTRAVVSSFEDRLDLTVRTTGELGPSAHFVSAGRWALAVEPDAGAYALLAGDDEWTPGFVESALDALTSHPEVGAVFPAFVWSGGDEADRVLAPYSFLQRSGPARRRRAILLPDRRELANLVYGVFRRAAFDDLMTAWERGGDSFASDYAAAWCLLGDHRVVAAPEAVGRRHVRRGADLIERAWVQRGDSNGLVSQALLYMRLNVRVNNLIAAALARVDDGAPAAWQVQAVRAPQWVAASLHHLLRRRASASAGTVGGGEAGSDGAQQDERGDDRGERGEGRAKQRVPGKRQNDQEGRGADTPRGGNA